MKLMALAMVASAVFGLCVMPVAHAQTYLVKVTMTDLNPPGSRYSEAFGISGDTIYGEADSQAVLWASTAASAIKLNTGGFGYTQVSGVSGSAAVGEGFTDNSGDTHALLWKNITDAPVDLTPEGFSRTSASGISGTTAVGLGVPAGGIYYDYHALLWNGSAASYVDLNPMGFSSSAIGHSQGDTQVGSGVTVSGNEHALLWMGTASSVVDLNPAHYSETSAGAIYGNTQVGSGSRNDTYPYNHALMWHGTAQSVVDLHPSGFESSGAGDVSGNTIVGAGFRYNDSSHFHALLWKGAAASAIDLNAFLPTGYTSAIAYGVKAGSSTADVVGYGDVDNDLYGTDRHAFLWHISFQPTVSSIAPVSRAEGSGAFTLTYTGTNFSPGSVLSWNGVAQPTTYFSPTKLAVTVPASLIAVAGTAGITVTTPHVGTSTGQTFTVYNRPYLYNLFPSNKKAGSGGFTLTVNGTGFLPSSFVKWNGDALTTTYVSKTQMTAFVSASRLHQLGTEQITVTTPHVATSGKIEFTVTP